MSILQKLKYQIYLRKDLKRRFTIINNYQINILLDIGANTGQYATKMRNLGYLGKIISFEPVQEAFQILAKSAKKDKNWVVKNYALGDKDTTGIINVSGSSDNSSILEMLPVHSESSKDLKYVGQQEIEIKKTDTIFSSFVKDEDNVMLKIDTQGFEKNVIDGALKSLKKIKIIQLEMSIVPLYENEILYREMITYLEYLGFQLYSLENGHYNRKTGQLLQVDGIFVNKNDIAKS